MCAERFLFLIDNRNEVNSGFVIKDLLKNKINSGSLFVFRIALFSNKVLEQSFSSVIFYDVLFILFVFFIVILSKFIFNNFINFLIH